MSKDRFKDLQKTVCYSKEARMRDVCSISRVPGHVHPIDDFHDKYSSTNHLEMIDSLKLSITTNRGRVIFVCLLSCLHVLFLSCHVFNVGFR